MRTRINTSTPGKSYEQGITALAEYLTCTEVLDSIPTRIGGTCLWSQHPGGRRFKFKAGLCTT